MGVSPDPPQITMKFLVFALLVAAASAKDFSFQLAGLAPPTELEYGFCDGSPEPITLDVLKVTPFPILVQNGATVHLNLVLEGIIPIKIPCLEIEGLHIGSCDYDADYLLGQFADFLCPTYVPEGQACALPLMPGVYGGGDPAVLGPIENIPEILIPFLKGTIRAEATVMNAAGETLACIWVRAAVDH